MNFLCPRCAKKTRVLHSPRKHPEGGLLRRHRCTACGFQFETLQVQRGAVDAVVLRRFDRQFAANLAALEKVINGFRGN
jgi:transcriptional regulator NrdR family protein